MAPPSNSVHWLCSSTFVADCSLNLFSVLVLHTLSICICAMVTDEGHPSRTRQTKMFHTCFLFFLMISRSTVVLLKQGWGRFKMAVCTYMKKKLTQTKSNILTHRISPPQQTLTGFPLSDTRLQIWSAPELTRRDTINNKCMKTMSNVAVALFNYRGFLNRSDKASLATSRRVRGG